MKRTPDNHTGLQRYTTLPTMRPSERINIHPSTNGTSTLTATEFDVVCVGSGWAGHVLAARIVKAGLTAIIVEHELVGGECPYWACVPSKTLLRSPQALEAAQRVDGAKQQINSDKVDVLATMKRRDTIVMDWDDTKVLVPFIESAGVVIVRGFGRLIASKSVAVISHHDGRQTILHARLAVAICTGSEPVIPDIPGLRTANPWTPRDGTSSAEVPNHLLILGAGAVGCEMATAYVKFGAQVTLISTQTILPGLDPEAIEIVSESLRSMGVAIYEGVNVVNVDRVGPRDISLQLSTGQYLHGTELLIAAGRKARINGVGLESMNYIKKGNFIDVHEDMCVKGVEGHWLYAIGDVNGRGCLTHTSKYQASIAANAIIARYESASEVGELRQWTDRMATADKYALPRVIFTDPAVATVGMTRVRSQAEGRHVRAIATPLKSPDGIHGDNESRGWAQWLLDGENRLVGATFVGTNAAELLHASTVAIVGELTLDRLRHAIPSWPTLSWVYYDLLDAAGA